jgi:hypothetical protein
MKVYLFNADTDLAMAHGGAYYMPPASVKQFMADLAMLPYWYAEEGSAIVACGEDNANFLRQMNECFHRDVKLISPNELSENHILMPWGWNVSLRQRLMEEGVDETLLPSDEQLATWRILSSRHNTEEILNIFEDKHPWIGRSWRLTSMDDCRRLLSELSGGCVLKLPWSGSGKGLNWCRAGMTPHIEAWCAKALRTQGSIQAAPIYNKVLDFAMEFVRVASGELTFVGYSRFGTNESGAYQANHLALDEEIEAEIAAYLPPGTLAETQRRLMPMLDKLLANHYWGYLGVDMMVCREGDTYRLHPCVEVNMRMNMGVVAHNFYRDYVVPGAHGLFEVKHFHSPNELRASTERIRQMHPVRMVEGRISSGFFPLVPITKETCNLAYVLITKC